MREMTNIDSELTGLVYQRKLCRDGLYELCDGQGLVLKSTLRFITDVVVQARNNFCSLRTALSDLLHAPDWASEMEREERAHKYMMMGYSHRAAWDKIEREDGRYN